MATEKLLNFLPTGAITVGVQINPGDTSITVSQAVSVAANFRFLIDSEYFLCTAGGTTTTWTVTRAAEGTTAGTHVVGASVTVIPTAGGLNQMVAENIQRGVSASLPAVEKAGRIYLTSDYPVLQRDNGSTWDPHGLVMAFTKPPTSSWSALNHTNNSGTTTVTQDASTGVIVLSDTGTVGQHLRGYTRTKASPYTLVAAVIPMLHYDGGSTFENAGVMATDGTKVIVFGVCADAVGAGGTLAGQFTLFVGQKTTVDAGTSGIRIRALFPAPTLLWLKIVEDVSHRTYYWSADGVYFNTFYQEAAATFLTTATIGIYCELVGGTPDVSTTLYSWSA